VTLRTPLAWLLLAGLASDARGATVRRDDEAFFETRVRPLLSEHCFGCHSEAAPKVKGGLKLDSRAALQAGGESGAAVVPGDPAASELIAALRYDGLVQMPPKGKLAAADIATLEEWVRRGAYFPDGGAAASNSDDVVRERPWSFEPVQRAQAPQVRDELWCRNDIDRFVLARLEAAGLAPAPEADRRTLLRRLSFDLTGLPPTADELASFEADRSPDAWTKQVERLLASAHYGERHARYWLDLARYSDSNGLDENLAMSNAHRYRDWVVRALNQDLAYDAFLTWQLAGDLLPEPDDEAAVRDQLAATGFLVLGPKMLAEQDKEKLVCDVVDEQMDVAFRTFQGLTMGCARCHDHKFDPLSQRDYYALAGIFKSTATMANLGFVSRWNERPLGRAAAIEARREHAEKLETARRELATLRERAAQVASRSAFAALSSYMLVGTRAAWRVSLLEAEEQSRGNLIRDASHYGSAEVAIARSGTGGVQFAEYDLAFARPTRARLEVRYAAQESRPMVVKLDGNVIADRALGESTGSWKPDGQRWSTVATFDVRAGRNVLRLERDGPMPHLDQLLVVTGEDGAEPPAWPLVADVDVALAPELVRAWAAHLSGAERRNDALFALWSRFAALPEAEFASQASALSAELRAKRDAGELGAWNPLVLGLLDGLPPQSLRELAGRYQVLFAASDRAWSELKARDKDAKALEDAALDALRKIAIGSEGPLRLLPEQIESLYTGVERVAIAAKSDEAAQLEHTLPPQIESAPAVRDAEQVADMRLLRRGSHLDPVGEALPRGVPAALAGGSAMEPIPAGQSGRLQLARWMTSEGNPLTARVAANRIWQGHFGRGLVASSSNFGVRGDLPTHPELLDFLASELVARGWSQKALHRLICQSATYRMASDARPEALDKDVQNTLLSRQNRRRLDAESLRDALLAASGQLDLTLGGTLLGTGNGDYVTNDQSANRARYDVPRRSLYLPIIRNAMLDLFSSFDYPDPSVTVEARPETTSPSQALYLMNSPLVVEASRKLVAAAAGEGRERVERLYLAALGRRPQATEEARALRFVGLSSEQHPSMGADVGKQPPPSDPDAQAEAWRAFAQVLLVSNEFLYVD